MGAPPPMRDPHTGCLLWQGTDNGKGYGTDWSTGRPRLAHYVAWEAVHGPVPAGKQLDHGCRRRRCVALAHLELVSQSENLLRRSWAHRSRRSHCLKGHDLFLEGRRTPEGGIVCLRCSGVR
jgi:hypothetical protein